MPWGHVCGFPTPKGDLYGGGHYVESASAKLTLQGQAIKEAAVKFGDGETLCFTPCKKGYIPIINDKRMFACPLHDEERRTRVKKEGGGFRPGEMNLNTLWKHNQNSDKGKTNKATFTDEA